MRGREGRNDREKTDSSNQHMGIEGWKGRWNLDRRDAAKCGKKEGRVGEIKDLKSIHLSFELPGFVSASHNGNIQ